MASFDRVVTIAKELLVLREGESAPDLWLWEHSERVMRLTRLLGSLPELADDPPDPTAAAAAALFHDAGWADLVQNKKITRWQVLNRPTNDIQREIGAGLLHSACAELLAPETLALAAEAIRQCNDRYNTLPEAQVLAEAENLDEIGVMYLLRQFRQYQAEGRPLRQMLASWRQQKEYRYWEARVNDGLRFESTRRIARQRLEAVEQFMDALRRDGAAEDVLEALQANGIDVPPFPS